MIENKVVPVRKGFLVMASGGNLLKLVFYIGKLCEVLQAYARWCVYDMMPYYYNIGVEIIFEVSSLNGSF